jgi:restriction endonuclease Mrr
VNPILVFIGLGIACAIISAFIGLINDATNFVLSAANYLWTSNPLLFIGFAVIDTACVGVIAWGTTRLILDRRMRAAQARQAQAAAAEAARQAHLAQLHTLSGLLALTPTQFEEAVGQMLTAYGYRNVQRTGGAGDLAADLTCIAPDGRNTVVQCKLYAPDHTVGSPVLQTFIGMVTVHHRAGLGLLVTTSGYTKPAMDLARQHAAYITLLDGPQVAQMMQRVQ